MNQKWESIKVRWIKAGIKALLFFWFRIAREGEYKPRLHSLLIANKTSTIDALLLSLCIPERLTFICPLHWPLGFGLKILTYFADVLPIDLKDPSAKEDLIRAIEAENRCVFFPEGLNEELSYDRVAAVIEEMRSEVIALSIQGAQNSIFSLSKDKFCTRLFPKITVSIKPPCSFVQAGQPIQDADSIRLTLFRTICELQCANWPQDLTLFEALIRGTRLGRKHGGLIEDSSRTPIHYKQFLMRCFILGGQIKKQTQIGEAVGLMMPTTTAGMISFFSVHACKRIPAMLNFSMGFYSLFSACSGLGIKTIYTSSLFVATAQLGPLVEELKAAGLQVRFLEDFKFSIHLGHKLSGLIKGVLPSLVYRGLGQRIAPTATALILFTSGSEGAPKAVALSHSNVLTNCFQMMSRVDFTSQDVFFNALPIFHCFGLTAGSVLPLIAGMNCFFYPSPLHYKIIPGLVRETKATILFGTDTFLNGYARAAEGKEFSTVRYVFAGAEKVKPETIRYWAEALGVTVYEGYGATEASPVISLNCPLAAKPGSVGMILPFMESRLVPVEGIQKGGRLLLRGPNVMLGYIKTTKPYILEAPLENWHDTGDIVTIDKSGFITLVGRAKRFAKIAGEMISLTAVEGIASVLWPELLNAAIIKILPGKGERIVLYSEAEQADKTKFIEKVRALGYSELLVPYQIFAASAIPVFPSGKIDYLALEKSQNRAELVEF